MRLLSARVAATAVLMLGALLAACSDETGGRAIVIVANNEGCTPAKATAAPGEHLTLKVTNESNGDREIEGIEGTELEELEIPSGKTRNVSFTMPNSGTAKVKCYVANGPVTIIEIAPAAATPAR